MSAIKGWEEAGRPGSRERPILFSGAMVRAILDGRKAQTRRVVKGPITYLGPKGDERDLAHWGWAFDGPDHNGYAVLARGLNERHDNGNVSIPCPYGVAGDRLWVRETWRTARSLDALSPHGMATKAIEAGWKKPWAPIKYEAGGAEVNTNTMFGEWGKTRVSIHMPRWASRITLAVTEVRVERLQDISEEDARAEGVKADDISKVGIPAFSARGRFQELWESINGERPGCSWGENPWIWAISFALVNPGTPVQR